MRKKSIVLGLIGALFFGGIATADYIVKDGGGTTRTIFAFVCATTKICPASVPIDSTGAEIPLATLLTNPTSACAAAPCLTTIGNVGIDPSSGVQAPTEIFLALPATTTTQIIALSGSLKTYVTSRFVFSGGAVNLTFKYGTGSNCGTGTTTLDGPWPLVTSSGWTEGAGTGAIMIVPAGQALCVTTDASVSGGVKLVYQQK